MPFIYDETTGEKYEVDPGSSGIWSDYLQFRTQSAQAYMDAMADALTGSVANVPVLYTANDFQSAFQPAEKFGFTGLISKPGKSLTEATENAGKVFSMIEASARPMWSLSWVKPTSAGFQSKEEILSMVNASRALGSKGFIIDDGESMLSQNALKWLAECSSNYKEDKNLASYTPEAIYYPENASHTSIKQLSNGAWWLPTLLTGAELHLGANIVGYVIGNPADSTSKLYVCSSNGPQTIHVVAKKDVTLVRSSGGETTIKPVKPKKGQPGPAVALAIGSDPVMVKGLSPNEFVPIEVVDAAILDLQGLITKAGSRYVDIYHYKVDKVKELYKQGLMSQCLDSCRISIVDLKAMLQTDKGTNISTDGSKR